MEDDWDADPDEGGPGFGIGVDILKVDCGLNQPFTNRYSALVLIRI